MIAFSIAGLLGPIVAVQSAAARSRNLAPLADLLPSIQTTQPIYALPGTLSVAANQDFSTYLITNDGVQYGLAGETPQLEQQILKYRDMGPTTQVKVWGALYPQGKNSNKPEIVVSAIILANATPAPSVAPTLTSSPTPTPSPTPSVATATSLFLSVYVRSGPGTEYTPVGGLTLNQSCPIIGRSADRNWWQIRCGNGITGWIYEGVVSLSGDTSKVPVRNVPLPTATPTVAAPPANNWKASYFTNRNLSGAPALVQYVPYVQFDWGANPPASNIPATDFSIRFERTIYFPTAYYQLSIIVDDGARLWLNDRLVLDGWQTGAARALTTKTVLGGTYNVRIEYFQASGNAQVKFAYADVRHSADWQVSYYNNAELAGNPVLTRSEPRADYPLDYDWGPDSPAPGTVNRDNWSGRWTGSFFFEEGNYQFAANCDDGVRVYIDGIRVIDAWSDGYKQPSNGFQDIGPGNHKITVEYYERSSKAQLLVNWYRISSSSSGGGGASGHDQ